MGESVDLIPMVPHLLGFSPQESLVVLCFHGKRLGPLMRVDLPPLDEAAETAEYLAAQSRRHGDRVALFAFSAHPDAPQVLQILLDRLLPDLSVIDAILVNGTTASFLPDAAGATVAPVLVPSDGPATNRIAAEAALRGRVALPSRRAVADSIGGPTGERLQQAREAVAAAEQLLVPAALRSLEWLTDRADTSLDLCLTALQTRNQVPQNCAAMLAVLARTAAVRDLMIGAMLAEPRRPWVPMLIQSLTQVPAGDSPDLSAMLAVMAYRAGDGALAQCAADRALEAAPRHRLAELMVAIMGAGMPPESLDDLAALADPTRFPVGIDEADEDSWGFKDSWDEDDWDDETWDDEGGPGRWPDSFDRWGQESS